ncbi:MAG TPA: cytochrome c [Deltaproteobacteria bacterium]|nr:cytochrome c [Deltaproteobacteria bacterium]
MQTMTLAALWAISIASAGGDAADGAALYTTYCAACHGVDGRGPVGANFVEDKTRLAKPDAELLASIAEGKTTERGAMPPFAAVLDERQRADVLAYIRATFGEGPSPAPPRP